jgi:hypothetical protein
MTTLKNGLQTGFSRIANTMEFCACGYLHNLIIGTDLSVLYGLFRCLLVRFHVKGNSYMKSKIFFVVTPCSSEISRHFGGKHRPHRR